MHEIRIESCSDAELLALMNREIQQVHAAWYPKEFKPWNAQAAKIFFEDLLRDPNTFAWVAKRDEMALGYVIALKQNRGENAFRFEQQVVHIDQLAVNETVRGQGIGSELVEHVLRWASQQKITRITIDHWARNTSAAKLYERMGFTNYMFRMEKSLAPNYYEGFS